MHDEELASKVIEGFLLDIPRQIEALKGFVAAGDVEKARLQAHSIKGAAANVGGRALSEAAYNLEKAGRNGTVEAVAGLLPQLESQFARLKHAMQAPLCP